MSGIRIISNARCSYENNCPSSSSNPWEKSGLFTAMVGTSHIVATTGGLTEQNSSHGGYTNPASVSGWMYYSEQGQMCGPYSREQLCSGLSSGFLPEDLPVYPIINRSVTNSVPLKYLQQFLEHANWATNFPDTALCARNNPAATFNGSPKKEQALNSGDLKSHGSVVCDDQKSKLSHEDSELPNVASSWLSLVYATFPIVLSVSSIQ